MRVLGMISGTSHDGIDAAVVDFALEGGMLRARILHTDSTPYESALRDRLVAALPPAATTIGEVCLLDAAIGRAFAEAARAASASVGGVDLVCSHGQTVFHAIEDGRAVGDLQLGQPAWIAEAAGASVVSDVRSRDIALGGQGAPLVSYLDRLLLARFGGTRAALNLGGISNVTVVARDADPIAYDIGPANALIDAVVRGADAHPDGFDRDGAIARSGRIDDGLLRALLDEPFYAVPPPRSTGKELFTPDYVAAAIARSSASPSTPDLVATLTELTVRTVAAELRRSGATTLLCSGGGWRNPVIVEGLRRELPGVHLAASDEVGVPADAKEAIAFALIGWCTAHGLPGTVPSATGATRAAVLGSITPGPRGLELPAPLDQAPTSLEVTS